MSVEMATSWWWLTNSSEDQENSFLTMSAELIRVDRDNDIALLKFTPKQPLKSVRFCEHQLMEAGEPVTVIENPVLVMLFSVTQ